MRALVTGGAGQLGSALQGVLGDETEAFGHELDIGESAAVEGALRQFRPDVVFNAAAFTQVDRCEREPRLAHRENALAPEALATVCAELGVRLVHLSTDYVFSGEGDRPWRENDAPAPRSVYGRTKLEGEARVQAVLPEALIVRTSWVYGRGRNFVAAILAQVNADGTDTPIRVVDDQYGRPTRAHDLAAGLVALVEGGAHGLYHLAGTGEATWWDLAREALDAAGHPDVAVARIGTHEIQTDAARPAWSVLDCEKAAGFGVTLPDWREALRAHLRSDDAPAGVGA
jgi:dTDP-4-dehydrorhamnose reductase